jgi:chromosome segregation ATPase
MEEIVKNRIMALLGILAVIFFLLFLGARGSLTRHKNDAAAKSALVFDLENNVVTLGKEKSSLSEDLKRVQTQLAQEQAAHTATKEKLSQELVAQQALKVELERVTRLKETLEKDLKDAPGKK